MNQLEPDHSVYSIFRYPEARSMNRKIVFHAGPTNSGKTYHAMERFLEAKSGVYCGPLKLLATEIYHKSNQKVRPLNFLLLDYFRNLETISCFGRKMNLYITQYIFW